jgi:Tfp pilus assembly protein PilF
MSEAITPSRIDFLATRVLAAILVVTPLVHSASLADAFSLPKEIVTLAGALLVLLAAIAARLGRHPAARSQSPVFILAALLVLSAALAILPSLNRAIALRGCIQIAAGATLAWGVMRFVRTPEGAALILRGILAGATLIAIAAVAQVFYPGLHLAPGGWSVLPASTGGTTLGSAGLTMQFLLLGLPAGVGATALSRGIWRSICGACLGLIAAALLFAGRPEAWGVGLASLALLAGSACVRVVARGGRWRDCIPGAGDDGLRTTLVAVITLLAVLALSRTPLAASSGMPLDGVSLLTPTSGDPAVDRRAAIAGAFPLLLRHPLGVGPHLWRHAFLEVAWSENDNSPFTLNHQSSHVGNAFIEMMAETGVAGGVLFVLLLGAVLIQSGHAARHRGASFGLVGFAAFNTVGTFVFASFYGSMMQAPTPALIFWIMVGLTQFSLSGAEGIALPRVLRPRERSLAAKPSGSRLAGLVALIAWSTTVAFATIAVRDAIAASRQTLAGQAASTLIRPVAAARILESPEVLRSPDYVPHFIAARAYFEDGQVEKAAARFGQVIDRSPFFISAYIGRARAYEALGRYNGAERDLDRALEIWPTHIVTRLARARLDALRGRSIEALEGYRSVLRDDPSLPEPFFRMGELLAELGRTDEAIQAFRACIHKDLRYPAVHLRLADAFVEKGMLKMAVQYYQAAIGNAPREPEPRLKLANTLYGMSRFCEARIALEGARDVEIDPARRATVLELIDKVGPLCRKGAKKK